MERCTFQYLVLLLLTGVCYSQQEPADSLTNGDRKLSSIRIQHNQAQPFINIPVFINDKGPFEFTLDTGASMSVITAGLAGSIGIKGNEVKEGMGAAGKKITVSVAEVDSATIADIKVKNIQFAIMEEIPKCVGQGVIGYNFLKNYILSIDYQNDALTFMSSSSDHHLSQEYTPFKLAKPDKPIILTDIAINKQKSYRFILDTGASLTVVSPELAQQMRINKSQADSISGVGGSIQSSVGTLNSLALGEVTLENVTVMVSDVFSGLNQLLGFDIDGIVGYNFLSNFKVEIDYPNELLKFEK